MSKKLYEETSIQDIADAIREKNGSTDTYTVAQMAPAIQDLSSGGGDLADVFGWKCPYTWLSNNYCFMVIKLTSTGYVNFITMDKQGSDTIYYGNGSSGSFYKGESSCYYSSVGLFTVYSTVPFCIKYNISDSSSQHGHTANYNLSMNTSIIIAQKNQGFGLFTSTNLKNPNYAENWNAYLMNLGLMMPSPIVYISSTYTGRFYNFETDDYDTYKYYGGTGNIALVINKSSFTVAASNALYGKNIYVPDANLDSYKSATNYSLYADYIYPISQCPYIDFNS